MNLEKCLKLLQKNKRKFLDRVQGEIDGKLADMIEEGANADEVGWFKNKMKGIRPGRPKRKAK